MKFLHTADWQIGMKAEHLGASGARARDERLAAGRRVIENAEKHGVDFVVIAGDLFEDNAVERRVIQTVVDILSKSSKPVYVLPGNHDPLVPGSVWEHPAWASAPNIHVLREAKPVDAPGCTLYPCPALSKHSTENPLAWIRPEASDKPRIGVAHGTVEGIDDELDYPIPANAAEAAGLDYVALGHWHSFYPVQTKEIVYRMAYCGSHEPTKFGERESGNALIVDFRGEDRVPVCVRIPTGGLRWKTFERPLVNPGDLTAVRGELEQVTQPETALVRVILRGNLFAAEHAELARIEDLLASGARFLHGRLDASELRPAPEDDSWIDALPAGPIREAARRLRDEPGESAEVATAALLQLYALSQGGRA